MLLPKGYAEYILCKEIYHCTPTELAEQDADQVELHLAFWNGEAQYRSAIRDMQAGRAGKGMN